MVVDRKKRKVEIRADLLIPGYYSNSKRKGQVPCEVREITSTTHPPRLYVHVYIKFIYSILHLQNIQICFPVPEPWIYKFRVEKHQKYGSLHATARKPGKVKGLERITTAFGKVAENYLPPSFIEVL